MLAHPHCRGLLPYIRRVMRMIVEGCISWDTSDLASTFSLLDILLVSSKNCIQKQRDPVVKCSCDDEIEGRSAGAAPLQTVKLGKRRGGKVSPAKVYSPGASPDATGLTEAPDRHVHCTTDRQAARSVTLLSLRSYAAETRADLRFGDKVSRIDFAFLICSGNYV